MSLYLYFPGSFNPEGLPEADLPDWVEDEKATFDYNLDRDQNGRLDAEEIRQWLVPDDATMFDVEARHLFYNADTNRVRGGANRGRGGAGQLEVDLWRQTTDHL